MTPTDARRRFLPAVAATALQLVLGYVLVSGLSVDLHRAATDPVASLALLPEPAPPAPPPPPRTPRQAGPRPEGAAAPRNLDSTPTPIVSPAPPRIEPPLIVTAPLPDLGGDATAGAADLPGPGTGAGGDGMGNGSGTAGAGDGGGGTPARWLRGRIRDSDYPRAAWETGLQGALVTRYDVSANGRVTACAVLQSSGSPLLDTLTCRLVMERYRYRPARAADGRRTTDIIEEDHRWVIEH